METHRKRYEEQLGMTLNEANRRLWKTLMLDMVRRLGEDSCYRCGETIESELSLDHKQPWRGLDTNRFWDLTNLAWSHKRCNSGAARQNFTDRKRRAATRNVNKRPGFGAHMRWHQRRDIRKEECRYC